MHLEQKGKVMVDISFQWYRSETNERAAALAVPTKAHSDSSAMK